MLQSRGGFKDGYMIKIIEVKRETRGDCAATVMLMIGLMLIVLACSGCTAIEVGMFARRVDTSTTTTTASDGNYLCALTGYCPKKEGK